MTAEECRVWRERIGALVLGHLDPAETAATEAHLDGCPRCREEAESLRPVAGLLSRANPDLLSPTPAPPARLASHGGSPLSAGRHAAGAFGLGSQPPPRPPPPRRWWRSRSA